MTLSDTPNKLLEFRTTFLRAVAEAWADPAWGAALTADDGKSSLAVLKQRFSKYEWPWDGTWQLRIVDSRSRWIDGDWVWPASMPESITVYLPLFPSKANGLADEAVRARAVADYYQQCPLLFGDTLPLIYSPTPPAGGPVTPGNLYEAGLMPSDTDFSAFKVALIAAMARAWSAPSFRELLVTNATQALNRLPNYTVPWDFAICVQDDSTISWSATNGWDWRSMTPSVLSLYLPPPPEDVGSQPLALAMYNATGARYPFTCCPC